MPLGDVYVGIIGKSYYNSLFWTYLNDADVCFQLRMLIRILELISVPNLYRDSFISYRLETLSSGYVVVGIIGK